MDWIRTGKEAWDTYEKFASEANDKNNPLLPYEDTYLAKYLPRLVFLRWSDAVEYGSGNLQYTQWKWKLPEIMRGYNKVSLVSIDYNRGYFTSPGRYICLEIRELQKSIPYTTLDTGEKLLSPTYIVPDRTSAPEFYTMQFDDSPQQSSCKGLSLDSLTVRLGDESLAPLVYNAPSGTFYCNVLLYFQ